MFAKANEATVPTQHRLSAWLTALTPALFSSEVNGMFGIGAVQADHRVQAEAGECAAVQGRGRHLQAAGHPAGGGAGHVEVRRVGGGELGRPQRGLAALGVTPDADLGGWGSAPRPAH